VTRGRAVIYDRCAEQDAVMKTWRTTTAIESLGITYELRTDYSSWWVYRAGLPVAWNDGHETAFEKLLEIVNRDHDASLP